MALGLQNLIRRPQQPMQGAAPSATSDPLLRAWHDPKAKDLMGFSRELIGQGLGRGAFGPSFLRDLLRKSAMRRAGGRRRRGDVLSGLVGLDPQQRRFQMLQDERDASGQLAGSLNEADIQGGQGYQDFIRQLFGAERQRAYDYRDKEDIRHDANRGGIGGFLGQVAGAGLGAFTGGLGGGLAENLTGGKKKK